MPKQQVRVQQRRVKSKVAQMEPPPPPPKGGSRALQPRMLEGYSPARVINLTLYAAAGQAVLLMVATGLVLLLFRGNPVLQVETVLFFLAAVIAPGTLVWPGLVLALRDRKADVEMYQGQMIGASPVSMVYGLGMVYLNTRQRKLQFNVERRMLRTIPQNQVQVAVRVTPNLKHVQSLQVIGPRFGGSVPSEVPEKFRIAERFPLYALGGTYGGVFGLGLLLLLLPLYGALLIVHVLLVPLGMALAALGARWLTQRAQKRLEASLQP